MQDKKINCLKCKHYYVTWDPRFPKGCRLIGFKSAQMPSVAVYKSDGEPCKGFSEKTHKSK